MTTLMAQGPLDRKVRAQAWIRRHKNDDPNDGHLYIDTSKEDADKWLSQYKEGYAWLEPLVSADAVNDERERCAKLLELRPDDVRLMAGEITAQEMRTVMAVLSCLRVRMRSNAEVNGVPLAARPSEAV